MITFATILFQSSTRVPEYGRRYSAAWVDKLYRGLARHHANPRLVCFVDQIYGFKEPVEQILLNDCDNVGWLSVMDVFRLEGTVLAMGVDTIITGNMDALADYEGRFALPEDQYNSGKMCNGVMLYNDGPAIYREFLDSGTAAEREKCKLGQYPSELAWIWSRYNRRNVDSVDELYPGWFCSIKWHILKRDFDPAKVRAVYFHGGWKPDNIGGHADCPEFLRTQWI